jgi:hypothetical protein
VEATKQQILHFFCKKALEVEHTMLVQKKTTGNERSCIRRPPPVVDLQRLTRGIACVIATSRCAKSRKQGKCRRLE